MNAPVDKIILKTENNVEEIEAVQYGTITFTCVNGKVTKINKSEDKKIERN